MYKFLIKLLLFSLPFIIFVSYIAYEILILPIDHFTFRAWEALKVYENTSILKGPFYPDYYLKKQELGDLSGIAKYPIVKNVEWYTDKYGYRNKVDGDEIYDIVVIGDSAIAGSSLTQSDMFTEKLGKKLKANVYAFAPSNFNKFLEDKRFINNPPDLVIFESVEKLVLHIPAIITEDQNVVKNNLVNNLIHKSKLSDHFVSKLAVYADRLKKEAFINYLYARLGEIPKRIITGNFYKKKIVKDQEFEIITETPDMIFYSEPEEYFKDWKTNHIIQVSEILKGYRDLLSKRGIKFIFMPIPNKENIYWELVNGGKQNNNLARLIEDAEKEGIVTINLLIPFQKIHGEDPAVLLYHLDDSHWNSYGVDVAVDQVTKKLPITLNNLIELKND